jgi:hypothetical protein
MRYGETKIGDYYYVLLKPSNIRFIWNTRFKMRIIKAEDGEDFQEYVFTNGERVKSGTSIGIEVFNPRTKKWELHLFEDIRFRN